jgi:trehalose utilization protein
MTAKKQSPQDAAVNKRREGPPASLVWLEPAPAQPPVPHKTLELRSLDEIPSLLPSKSKRPGDPLVAFLGYSLQFEDEIYQISDFDYRQSHVLLRLDPSSVDLKKTGVHQRFYGWPLAWKRFYGDGRVFYTALGQDARYQRILTNAILWSMRRSPEESK